MFPKEATRPFTNHPVCAEERDLFIEAQPPLLNTEGNELASTAVIEFETACLRQSPEIRRLYAPHPLSRYLWDSSDSPC